MTCEPAISIDFKRNRIRVHKAALHAIGKPGQIRFLVNPGQRAFAIVHGDASDVYAHRLHWPRLTGGHSFELHSKPLVKRLQGLCDEWRDNRTRRIRGVVVSGDDAVVFQAAAAAVV